MFGHRLKSLYIKSRGMKSTKLSIGEETLLVEHFLDSLSTDNRKLLKLVCDPGELVNLDLMCKRASRIVPAKCSITAIASQEDEPMQTESEEDAAENLINLLEI